jgi:hypothetical protein
MTDGLRQLDVLIGDWVGESRKYSEGRARTTVRPTEDGKFLRLESSEEDNRFPHSTQLIGSDEASDECTVLCYDSRDVRRVYRMMVARKVWTMWRDAPGFNQRYTGKISDDGKTITGQWEMSRDGKKWEVDFDLSYKKVND